LCSCQHYLWFGAGRDAVVIRQARITRPKHHLPNAYEILLTWYISFARGGTSFLANISEERGRRPPTSVGVRVAEWLPFHVVSKYPQCII